MPAFSTGETVELVAERVRGAALVAPVVARVRRPDGQVDEAQATEDASGAWVALYVPSEAGWHRWSYASANGARADGERFHVAEPAATAAPAP